MITIGRTPIFAAVLDHFLEKGNLSRRWYLATLLSLGGILLLMMDGRIELKANPLGQYLSVPLISGFFFAVTILIQQAATQASPASHCDHYQYNDWGAVYRPLTPVPRPFLAG